MLSSLPLIAATGINMHSSLIISTPLSECLFIDIETTSLDKPEVIELCIRNINGVVYHNRFKPQKTIISNSAYAVHKISDIDLINAPLYTEEESTILSILNGKRIVSYNLEFNLKALLLSSANPKLIRKYIEMETSGICLMSAIKFKLKRFKALSLIDACAQFEISPPAHATKNDTSMLIELYKKFKSVLIINPDEWLPNFIDIDFFNLAHCELNKPIPFWASKDNKRQALYRPHTSGGVGKIAEADEGLKHQLSQWASAEFMLQYNDEKLPLMKINFIDELELKITLENERAAHNLELNESLLNAKPVKNKKLRLTFKEYNYHNRYAANPYFKGDSELYQCKYSMGDTLYLDSIPNFDDFNFRSIHFKNFLGENCGQLLNLTQDWIRVFGLLGQGFRAEVLIIDDNKTNTKVDVYFFKD